VLTDPACRNLLFFALSKSPQKPENRQLSVRLGWDYFAFWGTGPPEPALWGFLCPSLQRIAIHHRGLNRNATFIQKYGVTPSVPCAQSTARQAVHVPRRPTFLPNLIGSFETLKSELTWQPFAVVIKGGGRNGCCSKVNLVSRP
jgi:hypothetical protein